MAPRAPRAYLTAPMTTANRKRILIVGGVAAGASCAARSRRLDEEAEIVVFERGPHVSFASCGLPYHVGDVIPDEDDLVLVTPERFRERLAIDVRVRHEVLRIDREARTIEVRGPDGGVSVEPYDALVLCTGSRPIRPPVEGVDLPGVFTVRDVPDTRRLKRWIEERAARRAVVVGAGFIGLELAENLVHRGLEVTVIERADQILAPLDPEMARPLAAHLEASGVRLRTSASLAGIEQASGGLRVHASDGSATDADVVVLGLGVRPEVTLAREAGLAIGVTGGVVVDEAMRTADPHVWAAGDAVEARCAVTGRPVLVPLAGPASREGRVAADSIAGRRARFRGVQGTAVCGVFGMTAATTGVGEKSLRAAAIPYRAVHLHPSSHVTYYPGAETIHLKLLFSPEDGRVLGAQAVGRADVDKRVDVLATAIQMRATVFDLEEAELCYAPQFGAAKDPVNVAGMIAANHLRGDLPLAAWEEAEGPALLVDVREEDEFAREHLPGARNVPLSQLRERLDELPRDREILLYCKSGKRSYDAARALEQRGFRVRTLPGGIESWRHRERGVPRAS